MALDRPLEPPAVDTLTHPPSLQSLTIADRSVWVLDQAVPRNIVETLYADLSTRTFTFTNQDSEATEFANHLIHQGELADENPNTIGRVVEAAQALIHKLGHPTFPLERVYVTTALFGDYQHVHRDGDVWTALYFVNPVWHTDWGGELLLYHDDNASISTAVAPRCGRLVIFDGMLNHRAGVPSKYCPIARLALVIKFLRS